MIVLGLGSNIGDRLANLRAAIKAVAALEHVNIKKISPVYISDALLPDNAPADWDQPYLNAAILCETTLDPFILLDKLKHIESSIGRKPLQRHWGPRIIDIDILAWNDLVIESDKLTVPHNSLQERPFALWPLADIAPQWLFPLAGENKNKPAAQIVEKWGSRFSGEAPFHTRQLYQRIDTPALVGVINVTPDSFSDGGQFLVADDACEQAIHLIKTGAEVIDIGAESTRPGATPVDPETEWQRLEPVITAINQNKHLFLIPPIISIDTRHPDVASKAIALDVHWINDQTGCDHPDMQKMIAQSNVDIVIMHHLSIPEQRDNTLPRHLDPVLSVYQWADKRIEELEAAGIERKRIILDPGIGFGKMAEQSLLLLQQVDIFKTLGVRVFIGHSRKSFLSLLTSYPASERDIETAAISSVLANKPVDFLRLHNIETTARVLRTVKAI